VPGAQKGREGLQAWIVLEASAEFDGRTGRNKMVTSFLQLRREILAAAAASIFLGSCTFDQEIFCANLALNIDVSGNPNHNCDSNL
jgi:hypothetical protein